MPSRHVEVPGHATTLSPTLGKPEAQRLELLEQLRDEAIGHIEEDQVLILRGLQLGQAVLLGDVGDAAHLRRGEIADRQSQRQHRQSLLLLRPDLAWCARPGWLPIGAGAPLRRGKLALSQAPP